MESKNAESIDKLDQNNTFIENGIPKKVDKNNVKGEKRKKCLRDKTAPRPPDSAYIQFLNDRRKRFRSENPNLSFAEITKVNTEWNRLSTDKKQLYHLAAECSKCIEKLVAAYKKTNAYKNCIQRKMKEKKLNTQIQEDEEDEEFKKEKSPGDIKLKKEQELKKEYPSDNTKLKKEQELKKEYPSVNTKLKKEQELKKEYPSVNTKLKKEQESIKIEPSYNNFNTVYDIPTVSDEFLIFNNAADSAPTYFYDMLMDEVQEVTVVHILTEIERSLLLDAFADIPFPDNIEPPTKKNIDTFMIYILPILFTSDTDPFWIENVKKILSNLDLL